MSSLTRRRLLAHTEHPFVNAQRPPPRAPPDGTCALSSEALFWTAMSTWGLTTSSPHDLAHLRALFDEVGEAAFVLGKPPQPAVRPMRHVGRTESGLYASA